MTNYTFKLKCKKKKNINETTSIYAPNSNMLSKSHHMFHVFFWGETSEAQEESMSFDFCCGLKPALSPDGKVLLVLVKLCKTLVCLYRSLSPTLSQKYVENYNCFSTQFLHFKIDNIFSTGSHLKVDYAYSHFQILV